MATQSKQQDVTGPDWPLGAIAVVTPGTPVAITSLVDPSNLNAPGALGIATGTGANRQFASKACEIIFFPGKAATDGVAANTGNVYVMRVGKEGLGNRDDYGSMVAIIRPTDPPFRLSLYAQADGFSPYRYFIDADTAADGAIVTLLVGG